MARNIYGTSQADTILGGAGRGRIHAKAEDHLVIAGNSADRVFGKGGDGTDRGASSADTLRGGQGYDSLYRGLGHDTLSGDAGSDEPNGGDNSDLLHGGTGNDQFNGQHVAYTLDAGAGQDVLLGGSGANTLTGGRGADTFVFLSVYGFFRGQIIDFSAFGGYADPIDLTGFDLEHAQFDEVSGIADHITQLDNSDIRIVLSGSQTILVSQTGKNAGAFSDNLLDLSILKSQRNTGVMT